MPDIHSRNLNGKELIVSYELIPDVCPLCHHAIVPKLVGSAYAGYYPLGMLQIIYQCTKRDCERVFIAGYKTLNDTGKVHHWKIITPIEPEPVQFSQDIYNASAMFTAVYSQAIASEAHNLTELTGIGFRKSLEYLVKDFAISQNPEKEENIKSVFSVSA